MSIQKTIGKRAPDGAWEIPILGDIGFFGTNGEDLIRELRAIKPETVKFIIYSPGGAVYDAIAVAGYVREQGIQCYAEIYGLCASAATVFAALAGPKNTAIAPGSMFLVHMPYGGDTKAIDNAVSFLVDLYVSAYGWTKAEAKKHMEAENGEGILWTAAEAKKLGVTSEIMEGAKVAARVRMINEQPTAMADNKKTVKVQATVKLTTMDAARAAFSAEGTTAEVEVDLDQAAADVVAEKEKQITELQAEVEALKAKTVDEATSAEALNKATQEAVTAKADLATAAQKHMDELKAKDEAHAKVLADLKAPLAGKTVADNQAAAVAAMPGTEPQTQGQLIVKAAMKGTNPLQKAQAELERERTEKQPAQ